MLRQLTHKFGPVCSTSTPAYFRFALTLQQTRTFCALPKFPWQDHCQKLSQQGVSNKVIEDIEKWVQEKKPTTESDSSLSGLEFAKFLKDSGKRCLLREEVDDGTALYLKELEIVESLNCGAARISEPLCDLAIISTSKRKLKEADSYTQKAIDLCEKELSPDDEALGKIYTAKSLIERTKFDQDPNNIELMNNSEKYAKKSIEIFEKSNSINQDHAFISVFLSDIFSSQGKFEEAKNCLAKALEICEQLPSIDYHDYITVLDLLFLACKNTSNIPEAKKIAHKAIAIAEEGKANIKSTMFLDDFLEFFFVEKDYVNARKTAEIVMTIIKNKGEEADDWLVAGGYLSFARIDAAEEKFQESINNFKLALDLYVKSYGENSDQVKSCIREYIVVLKSYGKHELAEGYEDRLTRIEEFQKNNLVEYKKLIYEAQKKVKVNNTSDLLLAQYDITQAYLAEGKLYEAESLARKILTSDAESLSPRIENLLKLTVAASLSKQMRLFEANHIFKSVLDETRERAGVDSAEYAEAAIAYGESLIGQNQHEDAGSILEEVLPVFERSFGVKDERYTIILNYLLTVNFTGLRPIKSLKYGWLWLASKF